MQVQRRPLVILCATLCGVRALQPCPLGQDIFYQVLYHEDTAQHNPSSVPRLGNLHSHNLFIHEPF